MNYATEVLGTDDYDTTTEADAEAYAMRGDREVCRICGTYLAPHRADWGICAECARDRAES